MSDETLALQSTVDKDDDDIDTEAPW